jgi:hypothetical protein
MNLLAWPTNICFSQFRSPKVNVQIDSVSDGDFLPCMQIHMVETDHLSWVFSYKGTKHNSWGLYSYNLITTLKIPSPNTIPLGISQHKNLRNTNFSPQKLGILWPNKWHDSMFAFCLACSRLRFEEVNNFKIQIVTHTHLQSPKFSVLRQKSRLVVPHKA